MADITSINEQTLALMESNPWLMYVIIAILIWKLVWYGLALWKTIKKEQKVWFVVLFTAAFVLNDLGILPIIYLIIHRDKKTSAKKKEDKGKEDDKKKK